MTKRLIFKNNSVRGKRGEVIHNSFPELKPSQEADMDVVAEVTQSYSCSHPGCTVSGVAERMWNLKVSGDKPRTILCDKHGWEARRRGLRTYRLSDSLAYERKLKEEKRESDDFFASHLREQRNGARNATQKVTLGKAVGVDTVERMRKATM